MVAHMLLLDFINVGYGDAILIRDTAAPFTMLVDCGDISVGNGGPDSRRISAADYLREKGIDSLDLLVLTHLHRDHSGGLTELLSCITVKEFWTNYLPPEDYWGGTVAVPEEFSAGSRCLLQSLNICLYALEALRSQGAVIRMQDQRQTERSLTADLLAELHTEDGMIQIRQKEIWDLALKGQADDHTLQELDGFINNTSLRICLHFKGRRIELPGDIYGACWEHCVLMPCDILKLPHHGHGDSLTPHLLEMLSPTHTVISVSNTRKDRCPDPDVAQALRQANSRVYFTDAVQEGPKRSPSHHALCFQISDDQHADIREITSYGKTESVGSY